MLHYSFYFLFLFYFVLTSSFNESITSHTQVKRQTPPRHFDFPLLLSTKHEMTRNQITPQLSLGYNKHVSSQTAMVTLACLRMQTIAALTYPLPQCQMEYPSKLSSKQQVNMGGGKRIKWLIRRRHGIQARISRPSTTPTQLQRASLSC